MRVLIAHNPRAGLGDAGLYDFARELVHRGAEIALRPLTEDRTLERVLFDADEFDRVVAAGGDGTVSSVAYLLRNTGIPVLPYPAGTANLVSLNLREPLDPVGLATTALEGEVLHTDLGEIEYEPAPPPGGRERRRATRARACVKTGFTGIAGVGADAAMIAAAQRLKPVFGAGAYLVGVLQNPAPKRARITLELDGRTVETEGSAVLLVNFARLQFDLSIVHDTDATDGQFEIVVVKARHVTELVPAVIAAMLDTVVRYPDRSQVLDAYRARQVAISSDPGLPLQTDGEALSAGTPLRARVLPLASTFVIPKM